MGLGHNLVTIFINDIASQSWSTLPGWCAGRFLLRTCERDLRSRVDWMVTVGLEERRSPNLLPFPMNLVVLTPVLIWDVLYGSGMENFGWTVSRSTAESEQRTPEEFRLLTFIERVFLLSCTCLSVNEFRHMEVKFSSPWYNLRRSGQAAC